ncbi:dicarboxylate/amino acid:cation symporter [Sorangium cellulosum]|uniref:Sodium:proton antiporter n=1 Tax=Sorangium cellulosum TaxID=56 RepID=A0A150PYY5_SORCE|nr:dicarboxylate/amino acid:cation symporter [Sorangium cellulosum]KYF60890.1 sodium:proton antiporter [Sorangium cellulosum]
MTRTLRTLLTTYRFTLILLASIAVGAGLGLALGERATALKPLGDLFLNLLFTLVVPLIFFSISSAVAGMGSLRRLGRIVTAMLGVFVATGLVASSLMLVAVKLYPPAEGLAATLPGAPEVAPIRLGDQIVGAISVPDFGELLSRKNVLPLIVMAFLVGLGTTAAGERGQPFARLLASVNEVMLKVVDLVMLYAPIGLGAYFAHLVGSFGPALLTSYVRALGLFYPIAIAYFFLAFTLYAWLAGRGRGVRAFWRNIPAPALTALATSSSMAAIPSNLEAARRAGVPDDIAEVIIPIGATIHMEGSCLSAVLKTALLFGLFGRELGGAETYMAVLGVAILSGTVMSGIPGGGFIGELVIVSLFGFPMEALPIISTVGALVDPPATLVNAVGDNVSCMVVARLIDGPGWGEMAHGSPPATDAGG